MIFGFDIDGVISGMPLKMHKVIWGNGATLRKILFIPMAGIFIYQHFRVVNPVIKEVLYQIRAQGYRIIVTTYMLERYCEEIEKWLSNNKIPFDKLVLPKDSESPFEFKLRAIKEERCRYFVEDQPSLARYLSQKLPEVEVICYRGKKEDLTKLLSPN